MDLNPCCLNFYKRQQPTRVKFVTRLLLTTAQNLLANFDQTLAFLRGGDERTANNHAVRDSSHGLSGFEVAHTKAHRDGFARGVFDARDERGHFLGDARSSARDARDGHRVNKSGARALLSDRVPRIG
jgi:hypothetical protein